MKKIIVLFLLISNQVLGQLDNCATAPMLTYDWIADCKTLTSPFPQQASICRSFRTGGNQVDFDEIITLSNCPNVSVFFTFYDSNCDSLTSNQDGVFLTIPNDTFTVCLRVTCLSGGGVRRLCTEELLTLPVELLYFTSFTQETGINLRWATATENNCQGFIIDRSTDLTDWKNIGYLEGSGNSPFTRDYTFIDNQPIFGTSFYRLVEEDTDGNLTNLHIIAVQWSKEEGYNPFREFNYLGQKIKLK